MSEVDVIIVTALKEEHDAARDAALSLRSAGWGVEKWEQKPGDVPYLFGALKGGGGCNIRVALARPTRMGSTATSAVASSLATALKPYCLAMCGVCAGNPADLALADIIIAEMVYAYDEGKQKHEAFDGDHRQVPMLDSWVRVAQDLVPNGLPSFGEPSGDEVINWLLERLAAGENPKKHPARPRYFPKKTWTARVRSLERRGLIRRDGDVLTLTDSGRVAVQELQFYNVAIPEKLPFHIKVGPIASGNAVVKDGLTWDKLRMWGVRSVLGLEMEAATIGAIAHRLGIPGWEVVKGVMDHADPRKDDRYKPFAARASAEVLFKLLALLPGMNSVPQPLTDATAPTLGVPAQAPSPPSLTAPPPKTRLSLGRLPVPPDCSLFVGRSRWIGELDRAWRNGHTNIIQLVADGGVGKSTILWHWLSRLQKDGYPDWTSPRMVDTQLRV